MRVLLVGLGCVGCVGKTTIETLVAERRTGEKNP